MRALFVYVSLVTFALTCSAQPNSPISIRMHSSYGRAVLVNAQIVQDSADFAYPGLRGTYAAQSLGLDYEVSDLVHVGLDVGVESSIMSGDMAGDSLPVLNASGDVILQIHDFKGAHRRFDVMNGIYVGFDLPWNFYIELGVLARVNISNNVRSTTITTFRPDSITQYVTTYDESYAGYPSFRFGEIISAGQSIPFGEITFQWVATLRSDIFGGDLMVSRIGGTIGLMFRV